MTSTTPEKPDVEKQNLADILMWKQQQQEIAQLPKAGMVDLVATDRRVEMPSDLQGYIGTGYSFADGENLDNLEDVIVSRADTNIAAKPLLDCGLAAEDNTTCFAALYTTVGLTVKEKPVLAPHDPMSQDPNARSTCRSELSLRAYSLGSGPIRAIAAVQCNPGVYRMGDPAQHSDGRGAGLRRRRQDARDRLEEGRRQRAKRLFRQGADPWDRLHVGAAGRQASGHRWRDGGLRRQHRLFALGPRS